MPSPVRGRGHALVGGTSVPTLFAPVAAIWHKSVGTEAPPTRALLPVRGQGPPPCKRSTTPTASSP
ncbi:DUF6053 domain-containing protein [Lysobacter enzymogenes]|uniref:DUF6053 domain-containing protein n=1 Tax=Lysobacter enzymogenes TaxID=69 RepID=UPI003D18B7C7